jgi:ATP-binding cassette subfamily B protein
MTRNVNLNKEQKKIEIIKILRDFFSHITLPRRHRLLWLVFLTILSSIAEIVSLGAVIPFITILSQPELIFSNPMIGDIVKSFGFTKSEELLLPITALFATAAVLAGILRLVLLHVGVHLANAIGADLSIDLYNRTLNQPYISHISRSSSEVISSVTQKVGAVTSMLLAIVTLITSTILFVAIFSTLIFIDPVMSLIAIFSFGVVYTIIGFKTKKILLINSGKISERQTQVVKSMQEGLGGIRDVLLDGSQTVYSKIYASSVRELQEASSENSFINQAPRFGMESVGIVIISLLAYTMTLTQGGAEVLPMLGVLALGSQRILPLLQNIYNNWSVFMGNHASLLDVHELLSQPLNRENSHSLHKTLLAFKETIKLNNLSFRYNKNSSWVVKDANLTISKGDRVGFVGTTGSGKSTLLDVLMSLLEPSQGTITVDDVLINADNRQAWQLNIAHVPQDIFLADATLAENIAFGCPSEDIDMVRVRHAAQEAKISDVIEGKEEGYNMIVGERGVCLSGGQKQRIGIARALYKNATVLIFDEATSALDNKTEKEVMRAINALRKDLTILIIAHRETALQGCDTIVNIENGVVTSVSS